MPKKITIAQLFKEEWEKTTDVPSIFCSGQNPQSVCPEQKHWVETYSPSRRKNNSYYRYVWREGGKLHHVHIGGNIKSARAAALKADVESAIALGETPAMIERLIRAGVRA